MTKSFLKQNLKMLFAAHHFVHKSRDPEAIADVVNLKPSKIENWMKSYEWIEALAYWGYKPKTDDLNLAENLWTEMLEKGEDLSPVEYPDKTIKCSEKFQTAETFPLLNSHLFCVDNLCDDEIRFRLAEEYKFESSPVRYQGQPLKNPVSLVDLSELV